MALASYLTWWRHHNSKFSQGKSICKIRTSQKVYLILT